MLLLVLWVELLVIVGVTSITSYSWHTKTRSNLIPTDSVDLDYFYPTVVCGFKNLVLGHLSYIFIRNLLWCRQLNRIYMCVCVCVRASVCVRVCMSVCVELLITVFSVWTVYFLQNWISTFYYFCKRFGVWKRNQVMYSKFLHTNSVKLWSSLSILRFYPIKLISELISYHHKFLQTCWLILVHIYVSSNNSKCKCMIFTQDVYT